jgi:hypothetical protein
MPGCLIIKQGEWVCLGLSVGAFWNFGPRPTEVRDRGAAQELLQTPKEKGKVLGVVMVKMNRHYLSSVRPRDVRGLQV